MKSAIFNYELKYWLKSPLTYIFVAVFFGLALIMMLGTGGFFDGPSNETGNVRLLNSPHEINFIFRYFNKFLLFLIPVIVGTSLYRDYKSRTFHITYSFPMAKRDYLLGKLWSSVLIVIVISLFVGLGLMIGEWILGIENPKIGVFNIWSYIHSYAIFTIPNLLFFSVLVFVVVGMSRNIYAGFITILLLFLFQIIVENLFTGKPFLIALFDPFAQNAVLYETHLWTRDEVNTKYIPVIGIIFYNRILWATIVGAAFFIFYKNFELLHESPFANWLPAFANSKKGANQPKQIPSTKSISQVDYDFSFVAQFKNMLKLSIVDFKFIIRSWMFFALAGFGILALVFILLRTTNTGEFNLLPVTRTIVSTPLFFYSLIIMLATFIYGGMLVHRAKNIRMNHLIDATPIPNWSLLGSKTIALILMQISLLLLLLFSGIIIQIYNGHFHFEFGQYLFRLFVITLPMLAIWAVCSIFVHTISPNLFLGLFVLILIWLGVDSFQHIGLQTQLLKFNAYPSLTYSDFYAYGQQLPGYFSLIAYWLSFAGILTVVSYLFWQRGLITSIKERFSIAKNRMKGIAWIVLFLSFGVFLFFGFKIYKAETNAVLDAGFNQSKGDIMANYKTNFGQYADTPQPKITFIDLDLAIFPEENRFDAKAVYNLKNKTSNPIDLLLIKTGFDEITKTIIPQKHRLIARDSIMQFAVYQLENSIPPNDSITIQFEIKNKANSLFTRNSGIIKNGTYLKHDILPRLGYAYDDRVVEPSDSTARMKNYFYSDADLVQLQTKISTSDEQIAIAPGDLISERKNENGRNHYVYKTNKKVKLNFSFHFGMYEVQREKYKGIDIEVFHHENHTSNVEKMIHGLEAALDYNTKYFGAYPFSTIRIIEYPHTEEDYSATLMANNIPTSEIQFIINSAAMEGKIDMPFYVMAHELTHQWFGNDAMPAAALGAKMLTESITEYITLNIYKQILGKEAADRFLQVQHKRYLRGRAREGKEEHALYRVKSGQQYIAYGKGAVAFNTLAHYIGEEKMNSVLKEYLMSAKTGEYPTSLDLIARLKAAIDDNYHYLINDFFETITHHDIGIDEVKYNSEGGDEQTVNLSFSVTKYKDGKALTNLNDDVEIGLYNDKNELIQLEKTKVTQKTNHIKLVSNQKVHQIILDPNYLLIDKERANNSQ